MRYANYQPFFIPFFLRLVMMRSSINVSFPLLVQTGEAKIFKWSHLIGVSLLEGQSRLSRK